MPAKRLGVFLRLREKQTGYTRIMDRLVKGYSQLDQAVINLATVKALLDTRKDKRTPEDLADLEELDKALQSAGLSKAAAARILRLKPWEGAK